MSAYNVSHRLELGGSYVVDARASARPPSLQASAWSEAWTNWYRFVPRFRA